MAESFPTQFIRPALGLCALFGASAYLTSTSFHNHSVERGLTVLAILIGWCFLKPRRTTGPELSERNRRLGSFAAWGSLAFALTYSGLAIYSDCAEYYNRGELQAVDQPVTTMLAAQELAESSSPWAEDALIDNTFYGHAYNADWDQDCVRRVSAAEVQINRSEACEEASRKIRSDLRMMGYKYGPILPIMSLLPVQKLGYWGIGLVSGLCVLLFAASLAWLLLVSGYRTSTALLLTAFVLVLPPVHETIYRQMTDPLPTALMLFALAATLSRRQFTGGLLCALSVGVKLLPGPFVGPILLRRGKWPSLAAGLFLGLSIWLVPIMLIDPMGYFRNIVLFILRRNPDPTALAWAMGPWFTLVGTGLFLAWIMLYLIGRLPMRYYLVFAMGTLLLTSKIFHDDYMMWWIPLLLLPPLLDEDLGHAPARVGAQRARSEVPI
jgi:multisubunit Na+/H+ antiporter MnhC subunit